MTQQQLENVPPRLCDQQDPDFPDAPGGPRVSQDFLMVYLDVCYEMIRRYHAGCEWIDGEELEPVLLQNPKTNKWKATYSWEVAQRVRARMDAVATGQWEAPNLGSVLSQEKAAEHLKKVAAKAKRLSKRTFDTRTLAFFAELWGHKREELDPEGKLPKEMILVRYGRNWYVKAILDLLLPWLAMPAGHYGTADDPRRDLWGAAEHLGITTTGFRKKFLKGKLKGKLTLIPDWNGNGKGEIDTFRLAQLNEAKKDKLKKDGQMLNADKSRRLILRIIAQKTGIGLGRLTRIVWGDSVTAEKLGIKIPSPQEKQRVGGGRPADSLTEQEGYQLAAELEKALKKKPLPGYATATELKKLVNADSVQKKLEVGECLTSWEKTKELTPDWIVVENEGRLQPKRTYSQSKFLQLWEKECTVNVGAKLFRRYVLEGTPRPVEEVKETLYQQGFTGRRLDRARKLAGIQALQPIAFGPFVYERPPKRQPDNSTPRRRPGRPTGTVNESIAKRNELLKADYLAGTYPSITELGRAHKVSRGRASNILREMGVLK